MKRERKIPILLALSAIGYLSLLTSSDAFSSPRQLHPWNSVSALHMLEKHDEARGGCPNNTKAAPSKNSWHNLPKDALKSFLTFGLAFSLALPTFASDSSSLLVGQKYWTIMNEGASRCLDLQRDAMSNND